MFRGETEAAQLELIFNVTGYPQGETLERYKSIEQWPAFANTANAAQPAFLAKYGTGRNKVLNATGLDLLQRLLDIDPVRRITAGQALQHEYFAEGVNPAQ